MSAVRPFRMGIHEEDADTVVAGFLKKNYFVL
jgi:hypothetical protein